MLKSKVHVLIKIAEMTVWEKTFRETDDDVREDVEKKKKMPGELFKGTIRFFDYCGHSDIYSNLWKAIYNARLKLAKHQANAKPEAELLLFENYSHSSHMFRPKIIVSK